MDSLFQLVPPGILIIVVCIALVGGVVKGVVGFAMPMLMISGIGSLLPPDVALAALIVPTLAANLWQAFLQGVGAAWLAVRDFRVFLITGAAVMLVSSRLVGVLPGALMLLMLGGAITAFALSTLMGRGLRVRHATGPLTEGVLGVVAGFFGGISGVWGPPLVAMLTARDTEKSEQLRVQGVIYALGSALLVVAHLSSGVLNARTLPLSLAMVPPALIGMAVGLAIQNRIDQRSFRKITLAVLLFAGLNLVRRGLIGL